MLTWSCLLPLVSFGLRDPRLPVTCFLPLPPREPLGWCCSVQ